ncbi:hypothetical protein J6590_106365, partial [Homalodisca vitripennis]
ENGERKRNNIASSEIRYNDDGLLFNQLCHGYRVRTLKPDHNIHSCLIYAAFYHSIFKI